MIQDTIAAALLVVTKNPTFSWSWNGGVMGDLFPVEEHLLRHLSRAGVLFECCLLLEEDPLGVRYICKQFTSLAPTIEDQHRLNERKIFRGKK